METIQFFSILIPIFSVFIVGYIVGKVAKLDIKSLSFIALNVLYPFLGFYTFYKNEITIDYLNIFIVIAILITILYVLIIIIANLLKFDKKRKHAMLLAGVFMNSGNYGVPVALFAIGEQGFNYALMFMVVMSVLMNSLGLYLAASGANKNISKKQSLVTVLKMPILPSVILGMILQLMNVTIPAPVEDTIDFISDAAIPVIMIVLGIQLSKIKFRGIPFKSVGFTVLFRLLLSPIITIGIVYMLGIDHTVLGTTMVLLAAMPTAANTTIFAVQFEVEPNFVSSTTLIGTVLSIVTLPIWFFFL
ncbi:AEC family transporter [Alkalihalobacillus sp. AL-G]|uniref:AEC family transporter n=1 Tax=Alkalihalobacillus sp. AL-G TaxID=2926399 RepID=UPI00272AA169|nr:AEC family transporter [Alkalihalobacillus sp. AL-G]WLD94414.1 AEC family transporter [Alkalihalobacillus sp. AL-G]